MQGCHLKLPINVIARPFASAFRSPPIKASCQTQLPQSLEQKFPRRKTRRRGGYVWRDRRKEGPLQTKFLLVIPHTLKLWDYSRSAAECECVITQVWRIKSTKQNHLSNILGTGTLCHIVDSSLRLEPKDQSQSVFDSNLSCKCAPCGESGKSQPF